MKKEASSFLGGLYEQAVSGMEKRAEDGFWNRAQTGGMYGAGLGGLLGYLRYAGNRRKEDPNDTSNLLKNVLGGAALGGAAGGAFSGYLGGNHELDPKQNANEYVRQYLAKEKGVFMPDAMESSSRMPTMGLGLELGAGATKGMIAAGVGSRVNRPAWAAKGIDPKVVERVNSFAAMDPSKLHTATPQQLSALKTVGYDVNAANPESLQKAHRKAQARTEGARTAGWAVPLAAQTARPLLDYLPWVKDTPWARDVGRVGLDAATGMAMMTPNMGKGLLKPRSIAGAIGMALVGQAMDTAEMPARAYLRTLPAVGGKQ